MKAQETMHKGSAQKASVAPTGPIGANRVASHPRLIVGVAKKVEKKLWWNPEMTRRGLTYVPAG